MASAEELDELFAYLDQLELNERLEQEKGVVTAVELQGAPGTSEEAKGSPGLIESATTEADGGEPCSRSLSVSDELEATSFLSVGGECKSLIGVISEH